VAESPSRPPLEEALIGGRERRPIVLVPYDPQWPQRFAVQRNHIRQALGADALDVQHIGSTAVPLLAAKPIIDVLVVVADVCDESVTARLAEAGYVLRVREADHRMVRTPELDVHVHLWSAGDPQIARHLRFRDRLRGCAEDRMAYERHKRRLAARDWDDMNAYAAAKSPLIAEIMARAEAQQAAELHPRRGTTSDDP
jgi:GrpB-like predicted nucleotidyltransferase (UPF0157 family)